MRLLSCVLLLTLATPVLACPPLLQHKFRTLQGDTLDFCSLQGKAILVVNTASKCGFTGQFEPLEALYSKYRARGLMVVGFPSNDFRQELASNQEVARFCRLTYGVQFPMMEKTSVRGDEANSLYRALAAATDDAPNWNFHKYLIAPDGKTVYSFGSTTAPDSDRLLKRLLPMLKPAPAAP